MCIRDSFYTASTNEAGETEYQMTRLGRLAVYMGWIEDPEELAAGEVPKRDPAGQEEPGLWDRLLTLVGLRKEEAPQEEPQPYRLPTDVYKRQPGGRAVIPTGIAIALPSADYVALVFARSGLGIKHGVVPGNCVGVIDSDYRGEIMVGLYNSGESEYTVQPGDRIAQLMVTPVVQASVELVDELDETERGAGGFGSTGK